MTNDQILTKIYYTDQGTSTNNIYLNIEYVMYVD